MYIWFINLFVFDIILPYLKDHCDKTRIKWLNHHYNTIISFPSTKSLMLAFRLFWYPSTFKGALHCQNIESKYRTSHLAYRDICSHPGTSNTSPNQTPWKVASSNSKECPVDCFRILPLRKGYHFPNPEHKAHRWKVFTWKIPLI